MWLHREKTQRPTKRCNSRGPLDWRVCFTCDLFSTGRRIFRERRRPARPERSRRLTRRNRSRRRSRRRNHSRSRNRSRSHSCSSYDGGTDRRTNRRSSHGRNRHDGRLRRHWRSTGPGPQRPPRSERFVEKALCTPLCFVNTRRDDRRSANRSHTWILDNRRFRFSDGQTKILFDGRLCRLCRFPASRWK